MRVFFPPQQVGLSLKPLLWTLRSLPEAMVTHWYRWVGDKIVRGRRAIDSKTKAKASLRKRILPIAKMHAQSHLINILNSIFYAKIGISNSDKAAASKLSIIFLLQSHQLNHRFFREKLFWQVHVFYLCSMSHVQNLPQKSTNSYIQEKRTKWKDNCYVSDHSATQTEAHTPTHAYKYVFCLRGSYIFPL